MWNLFQNKASINNDLKDILEEVVSVRKVCMSSRASMLDMLQIKTTNNQGKTSDIQKKESIYWKTGENLLNSEKELKHKNSPLKEVLSGIGNLLQSVAEDHACFENDIQCSLGPDKTIHNLITKDYPNMQKDKDCLRKKQKEQENVETRYNKEKQKRELSADDAAFEEHHFAKEVRLKDDLENVKRETSTSEDKFTTTLYCLQAKEKELALNLIETLQYLKEYFNKVLHKVNEHLPKLETLIANSCKTKTYGESLENHLRVHKFKIALPLQIGVEGLKGKLKEEGLFRVSPSIPNLKKMKASIDAGVSKKVILRKYKDPHLYTSVIKYWLRELPDPLLGSRFAEDWKSVDSIKDELERMKGIKELIEKIPVANKNNITFLFHFLSKLVDEEFYNKMSIENLIVVLSPNLLWNESGVHIPIDSVYKTMIEHYELIFEDLEGLTVNPYVFITNNKSLASQEVEEENEINVENIERPILEAPLRIEKRNTIKRSQIKEKRKQYQDRSLSGDLRMSARKSMENLELNLQMDEPITEDEPKEIVTRKYSRRKSSKSYDEPITEDEPKEIVTRKYSRRKSSKSYDEDVHKSMLPSLETSFSSTTGSSSDPTLNSPTKESKSFDLGDSKLNMSSPTLKRHNTLMSRIPKLNFSMPKRNAKSVDVNR